jgi:hypothetical protein
MPPEMVNREENIQIQDKNILSMDTQDKNCSAIKSCTMASTLFDAIPKRTQRRSLFYSFKKNLTHEIYQSIFPKIM